MGRQRIQVPRGKFILRTVSGKKDVKSIYIYYSFARTPIVRPMANYQCREADWNPDGNRGRGELRASYGEGYKRMNAEMAKKLTDLDHALIEYNDSHPNQLTVQVVRDILDGKPTTRKDEGRDFVDFADDITENKYLENRIGHSCYKNRLSAMRKFKKFLKTELKKESLFIGDITKEVISKYIAWRKETEGNNNETINHSLTPIIDACERAADLGFLERREYADIKEMRLPKMVSFNDEAGKEKVRFLTADELKSLVDYSKTEKEPRRKEYLEMFMFAFHACGLRVVDIMTLQWKHIDFEKRQLKKVLVKTVKYNQKSHVIPMTEEAIQILLRWKEKNGRKRFVFGLLDDDFDLDNKEALYKARNNVTKCIDQSLTVVGEKLKFKHPLTMHIARHCYAVLALNNGMAMSVVSRLLGHSCTATTEQIYAEYLPDTLDKEANKLDFGFLAS